MPFSTVARCLFYSLALGIFDSVFAKPKVRVLEDARKYVTMPEVEAPNFDIKVYDKDRVSPGYWFVPSYDRLNSQGGKWQAPMIFDNSGELIWSGVHLCKQFDVFDFRISNVLGEDKMTMIAFRNHSAWVLDMHYDIVDTVKIVKSGQNLDMHEFHLVENGTRALYFHDKYKTFTDKAWLSGMGSEIETCDVLENAFHDVDVADGWKSVFNWRATEHIAPEENWHGKNSFPERCKRKGTWDTYHANSLDKFPDGSYLVSVRHTDTIYKVSSTGEILWRLGGRHGWDEGYLGDFEPEPKGFYFLGQHHARIISHNSSGTVISVFDNADATQHRPRSAPAARAIIVSLKEDAVRRDGTRGRVATLVREYLHPGGEGHTIAARGSVQVLPNGNIFTNWVDKLWHSEHTEDGKLVLEAKVDQAWLKSYRSYKFPYIGQPTQPPRVHAAAFTEKGTLFTTKKTIAYVSWNGATEVASWKLYLADQNGKVPNKAPLKTVPRNGFETPIIYKGHPQYVVAEALDKHGNVLDHGTSESFETITETNAEEEEDSKRWEWTSLALISVFALGLLIGVIGVCWIWRRRTDRKSWRLKLPLWQRMTEKGRYQRVEGEGDDPFDAEDANEFELDGKEDENRSKESLFDADMMEEGLVPESSRERREDT